MKYVLITGAYGGMGKQTAKAFVEKGFGVIALDQRIGEAEKGLIPIAVDITDEESVSRAFHSVCAITDSLEGIIHFAGMYLLDSLVEMEHSTFRRAFEVNLFGAALINRTFLPLLKENSRVIITTSELAPLSPLPFTGLYAVTKSALDQYAYSLGMELQLRGISVSVLRAGAVDTGMLDVSTDALSAFCQQTKLYSCNAERFRKIVEGVEARRIAPARIAEKTLKIFFAKHPKFAYAMNRNPLLLLLEALPVRMRFFVIRKILK